MNTLRVLASAFAVGVFGIGTTAAAQYPVDYEDGNSLWELCGSRTEGPVLETCALYVEGATEGLASERAFCLSPSVTNTQLADVVRRYVGDHPELRDKAAIWLVKSALAAAFPCAPARR
jgi:hypothetical protein